MVEDLTLSTIATEFRNYRLHILGLSETRRNGFGEQQLETGETLLFSGKEDENSNRTDGVALLISAAAKSCLLKWSPINERIIQARFKTRARKVTIVQCYAPTETSSAEKKDEFYLLLHQTLMSVPKGDILMLMGDFNAQIGSINDGIEHIIGKHAIGTLNDNGRRLLEVCTNFELVIGGTLFPHKSCHKITWNSPDGRTQNQIDHFAISRKWRHSLLDVRSRRGADVGSDHHLVVASIRLKLEALQKRSTRINRRYDVGKLRDDDVRDRFQLELGNKFELLSSADSSDIDTHWQQIESSINDVCEVVLGHARRNKSCWITQNTLALVEERKRLKNDLNSCDPGERSVIQARYNEAHKSIKKSARRDKRAWANSLADEAEEAAKKQDHKKLYSLSRELIGRKSHKERPVKDLSGSILTGEDEQLKRWSEHFREVLNSKVNSTEAQDGEYICSGPHLDNVDTSTPTIAELREALKSLKAGKAPGADGIPAEALKIDVDGVATVLHPLISEIWKTGSIPKKWKEGLIVKIPKKGDLSNCNNWRGIMLLSIPSKVLSKLILSRIGQAIEQTLRTEQAGFRANRSCTDQINTLRLILEQAQEFQSSLYTVFVDFEKAFDSVERDKLWKVLSGRGVPDTIVKIIQSMYDGFNCRVIHGGNLSESFEITTGVRQGCILSPLLFILLLDEVMRKTTAGSRRGISWGPFSVLEDLDYADDICLLSHKHSDVNAKLAQLWEEGMKVGLMVNKGKTVEMRVRNTSSDPIFVGQDRIEEVQEFCYLGSMVTADGGCDLDVETRIRKARGRFALMRNIWIDTRLSRNTKLRLFKSNVVSVLLYGCETWKVSSSISSKLQVFINGCLRLILRIRRLDGVMNTELWRLANMEPISCTIKRRK